MLQFDRPVWLASDLHLTEDRPVTRELFIEWLHAAAQESVAIVLLGDLFEVWVGDDVLDAPPPWLQACLQAMAAFSAKTHGLHVMVGNRDFLLGPRWLAAVGAQALPDPTAVQLPDGRCALLAHGDTWCTDDTDYQAFRLQVRSADWQTQFLQQPLADRLALAARYRAGSQARKAELALELMDVSASAIEQAHREARCARIIHGHTHRPGRHVQWLEGLGVCERWVLPDWDLDDEQHPRGGYLVADRDGLAAVDFASS